MNKVNILIVDDTKSIHQDFLSILGATSNTKLKDLAMGLFDDDEILEVKKNQNTYEYEIDSAYQGEEAYEMVKSAHSANKRYSVAFVDMRMPPGWDGIKTIQHLWKVDKDIQVVICSAYSDYSWNEIIGELEVSDNLLILKKPFEPIEISQMASSLSKKWELTRDLTKQLDYTENQLKVKMVDLYEANKQLKSNQKQLVQSEKMASIGLLAAGVAHEINNPVGFISSNLGSLKEYINIFEELLVKYNSYCKVPNDGLLKEINDLRKEEDVDFILDDVKSLLKESQEGTERVKKIVKNLKSFARPDDDSMELIDLNDCIEVTLTVLRNELKYKCNINKDFNSIPHINGNAGKLNQVFTNILINAGQAIEEHGDINIKTYSSNKQVFVEISDTGSGISEENLKKLFDPFFTTKKVGVGTGLGLSISHGIIEKHKGKIEVKSEINVGTSFIITLPIK